MLLRTCLFLRQQPEEINPECRSKATARARRQKISVHVFQATKISVWLINLRYYYKSRRKVLFGTFSGKLCGPVTCRYLATYSRKMICRIYTRFTLATKNTTDIYCGVSSANDVEEKKISEATDTLWS
jgi:hypothetical protein